ncbi:MAG: hypothetical protein AAFQ89_02675 [Cyanobacteria bacterium J06626_18]
MFSSSDLIQLAAPSLVLRHEFHHWVMEDGDWKRFESGAVLADGAQ